MIGTHRSMESSSDSEDDDFSPLEKSENEDEHTYEHLKTFQSEESFIEEEDTSFMALKNETRNKQKN